MPKGAAAASYCQGRKVGGRKPGAHRELQGGADLAAGAAAAAGASLARSETRLLSAGEPQSQGDGRQPPAGPHLHLGQPHLRGQRAAGLEGALQGAELLRRAGRALARWPRAARRLAQACGRAEGHGVPLATSAAHRGPALLAWKTPQFWPDADPSPAAPMHWSLRESSFF